MEWIPSNPDIKTSGPLQDRISGAINVPDIGSKGTITGLASIMEYLVSLARTAPGTPIRIIGDYDVDGLTSSTILKRILKKMGFFNIAIREPRRFSEGYGFSEKMLAVIPDDQPSLCITVDNGITAHETIAKAKALGATVFVIDHHIGDASNLPPADIVVDPNAIPGSSFNDYCAAGLCYRLAEELGLADDEMLALAAVGTVADVMPLVGDNRRIVKDGLEVFRKGRAPAVLNELMRKCSSKPLSAIESKDIAFSIGPCLNAWGRIADNGAQLALSVLNGDGKDAWRLKAANDERKKLKADINAVAETIIREKKMWGDKPLCILLTKDEVDADTPIDGMIGIIAGEQAKKLQSPCFVFTPDEDGNYKGSGRSFGGIHMKDCLDMVKDLLVAYGGHAGAAGLTVRKGCLEEFRQRISDVMVPMVIEQEAKTYDIVIDASEIEEAIRLIEPAAPFGEGNPYPVFKVTGVKARAARSYESGFFRLDCEGSTVTGMDLVQEYNKYPGEKTFTVYGTLARDFDFRSGAETVPRIEAEYLEGNTEKAGSNKVEELLAAM